MDLLMDTKLRWKWSKRLDIIRSYSQRRCLTSALVQCFALGTHRCKTVDKVPNACHTKRKLLSADRQSSPVPSTWDTEPPADASLSLHFHSTMQFSFSSPSSMCRLEQLDNAPGIQNSYYVVGLFMESFYLKQGCRSREWDNMEKVHIRSFPKR